MSIRSSRHSTLLVELAALLLGMTAGRAAWGQTAAASQTPNFSVSITEALELIEDVGTTRRIDQSDIEAAQARTLDEALRLLPGVYVRTGGDGTPRIDVRGLRSRHVLLLIDGVPVNSTNDGQFDPSGITTESIREIKVSYGSSSILYGDNALAAVIEVTTHQPGPGVHGAFGADLGQTDQRGGSGRISVAGARASLLVTGSAFASDGFPLPGQFTPTSMQVAGLRVNSDRARRNVLAKFGYDLSGSLKLNTLLMVDTGSYGIPPSTINDPNDQFARTVRYERVNHYQNVAGQVSLAYTPAPAFDLRSWAYVNEQDEDRARYDAATYRSMDDPAASGTFQKRNHTRISGAQLLGRFDLGRAGWLRLTFSGRREAFDSAGMIRDVPLGGSTRGGGGAGGGGGGGRGGGSAGHTYGLRAFDDNRHVDVYSTGAEWEFTPVSRTGVVLGVAEDWQQRPVTGRQARLSWLAGVSFDATRNVRLHAAATHKIRFPSIQQLYDEAAGNLGLRPEQANEVEVGVDRTWGKTAQLSVTGFSTLATYFIERESGARYMNHDRYRFSGMEAVLGTRVVPNLDLRASYSFLDSRNLSPASAVSDLQYRPRHRTTVDTRWTLPSRFSARAVLSYVADQVYYSRGVPAIQARAGDYALVDLAVTRTLAAGYEVTVGVQNVFDQLYEQAYGLPREGRTVLATIRGRF